jgi:Autotransporter beta-domain
MMLVGSRLRVRNRGRTCGKERPSGQAINCTATAITWFGRRKLLLATGLLLSSIGASSAHTVSIGYEALGGGVFDIWYGTYHAGVNYTEGSLQLVGPSISTTVAFTMLVTTKPGGLIDGTTNFYSNAAGTALTGTPVLISSNGGSFNGQASSVLAWQGVQFTGITKPGTYTFTYIPIAVPTQVWNPISTDILTATFTLSAQALGTTFTSLLPPGSPTNVLNVAGALDNSVANGGTLPAGLQNLYDLTPAQLSAAMSALSGEAATDSEKGAFALMNQFLGLMLDPFVNGRDCGGGSGLQRDPSLGRSDCGGGQAIGLAPDQQAGFPPNIARAYASVLKAPPKQTFDQRWTAWGSGFGGSSTTSGNAAVGSNNVTARDYGFASGMDYHFSQNTLVGFALAGSGTKWGLAQGLGGGRSDAFQVGIYGKSYFGPAYVAAALAFTSNWFTTNRLALGDQLTAKFGGESFGGRLESGYRFIVPSSAGRFEISPYAAVQAQSFHTPGYSETDLSGGGLGLNFNARNDSDTRSELGMRFADLTAVNAMPLILRARLAWAHDWVGNPALNAAFQALPGASFVVNGARVPTDSALASVGAELHMTTRWSVLANFDGEFAKSSQTYAGTGTLRYMW